MERFLWYESDAIGFIGNGATDKKIWSKVVWIWIWTNFEIWKLQKVYLIDSLDRWNQDENVGAGFI
jgi:hypothetical protein